MLLKFFKFWFINYISAGSQTVFEGFVNDIIPTDIVEFKELISIKGARYDIKVCVFTSNLPHQFGGFFSIVNREHKHARGIEPYSREKLGSRQICKKNP